MGRKAKTKKLIRELKQAGKIPENKGFFEKLFKKQPKKKEILEIIKTEPKEKPTKKAREEQIKEESIKSEPKTPGKIKKYVSTSKERLKKLRERIPKINKKKMLGGALVIIMILLLASVGYLLFLNAFKPFPIAKLLPSKDVIALLEINSNLKHNQTVKAFKLLENNPKYSKNELINFIENKFSLNYEAEINPWLGRNLGIVFLNGKENAANIVYFAEVADKSAAKNFAKGKAPLTDYGNQDLYISSDNKNFTFIDDYIFLSDNQETIKLLIDFQNSQDESLYSAPEYKKIESNMPISKMAFAYINFSKVNNGFITYLPILEEKGFTTEFINALGEIFRAEGFALTALDNNFALKSFLDVNNEIINHKYTSYREKYDANLAKYIPENAIAFFGGKNLEYQMGRFIEAIGGGEESTVSSTDKLIQNYTKKYFGSGVDFKKGILPLFKKEFAFVIEEDSAKNEYKILIELSDPQKNTIALHEILNNFAEMGAVIKPQVVEHILEDGTVSKELMAIPEKFESEEVKYEGTTVYELKTNNQNWGIYYAVKNEIAIIATSEKLVFSSLDAINGKIKNLKSSSAFDDFITPILKASDEISYLNLAKLLPELSPIETLSSGKNYFEDGITTVNYLRVK